MRMAEVDQSGYLRAKRTGKLAYKDQIKRVYYDMLTTSDPFTLASGEGKLIEMSMPTPSSYQFSAIYRVFSNHYFACHLGGFRRWGGELPDGSQGVFYTAITNRSGVDLTDVTITVGIRFIRLDAV